MNINEILVQTQKEMIIDEELIDKVLREEGTIIIKAAGNTAYPMA